MIFFYLLLYNNLRCSPHAFLFYTHIDRIVKMALIRHIAAFAIFNLQLTDWACILSILCVVKRLLREEHCVFIKMIGRRE